MQFIKKQDCYLKYLYHATNNFDRNINIFIETKLMPWSRIVYKCKDL